MAKVGLKSSSGRSWDRDLCVHLDTGSGEGIPKLYAYKKKVRGQEPQQVNLRNAAMLSVLEIDTFAALTSRGGSTLMPELRKAWMGEQLGFWWSDAEKRVTVMEHRYRMSMVVGYSQGAAGPF